MLSMNSFDFHLTPCMEGFLIHLSPLWQLPLFPSVEQFPCVCSDITSILKVGESSISNLNNMCHGKVILELK